MSNEIFAHIFRTLLMYFIVFFVMRMMGKREIGKLSVFDLVISIMMAEIAVFALEDIKRPLYEGFIPLATLLALQVGISYLGLKSRRVRLLFDGRPSILFAKGKLNRKEMGKQRYNLDDLLLQLREQNIESLKEVEFAILETTGKLNVIRKDNQSGSSGQQQGDSTSTSSKTKAAAKAKLLVGDQFRYEGLPIPLILDGKIQDGNLEKLNKTRFWLKNQIQLKGHKDFKDIFLCSMDHNGKLYINSFTNKQ